MNYSYQNMNFTSLKRAVIKVYYDRTATGKIITYLFTIVSILKSKFLQVLVPSDFK